MVPEVERVGSIQDRRTCLQIASNLGSAAEAPHVRHDGVRPRKLEHRGKRQGWQLRTATGGEDYSHILKLAARLLRNRWRVSSRSHLADVVQGSPSAAKFAVNVILRVLCRLLVRVELHIAGRRPGRLLRLRFFSARRRPQIGGPWRLVLGQFTFSVSPGHSKTTYLDLSDTSFILESRQVTQRIRCKILRDRCPVFTQI